MTLGNGSAAIKITAREIGWITAIVSLVSSGIWAGITFNDLTTEVRMMRSDICEFAVPAERRDFAYSCRNSTLRGLQAQNP
jgi:hypothetical protein